MAIKVFTAEGVPTNGTQLTSSNLGSASGDAIAPLKGVSASITGTANVSEVINGSASVKLVDTNSYAYLSWPENNLSTAGLRAYFRLSSTSTSYSIMNMWNGSTSLVKVILLSNGHLYVQDATGSVTYQTPSALTFPGVYAVDIAAQPGTTTTNGKFSFAVYDTTGDYTAGMNGPFSTSSANTGTTPITSLNVGKIESAAVSVSMIVDDIQRTDTYTLVGPEDSAVYMAVISPGDQTGLSAGQLRTLSAANSSGNPSVYQWSQTTGPPVTLANTNGVSTSYLAPATTVDSSVTIQLKVGDLSNLSAPVSVTDTIAKHSVWFMKNGTLTAGTFRKQTLPDTTVSVSNITSNSVTLTWTAVSGATSYLTGRNGTDSNGNGPYQTTDSATTFSRTFINLLPSTTYILYCTPQPNGTQKTISVKTAAVTQTQSWDWSDTNLPWAYTDTSVFTSGWPAGVTIVDLQTSGGSFYSRLTATVNAAGKRVVVRLPAGTHHLTAFNMIGSSGSPTYAFGFWHPNLQGFLGQGPDQTIIQMDPNSITQAQLNDMMTMDAGPTGNPNQLGFMRVDGSSASPILISGVTFRGTDQPNLTDGTASVKSYGATFPDPAPYNGLVFYSNSPGIVSYTRFQAAGHAKLGLPPFEHANVSSQYSPSMLFSHCEMDGRLAPEVDPTQPRRCGPVMANNETLHTMSDCWLHHSLWTRYAANDQNRDTYGTYNLTRTKIEQINASSAGWESCAATINVTDCIISTDTAVPSSASGSIFHLSLTPVGSRSNPQGGRLNVTRGTFKSTKYSAMDGYITVRAIASMHWVTDGYSTTMKMIGSSGQRLSPYVASSWPVSASTLSSAGVSPTTHYLVYTA